MSLGLLLPAGLAALFALLLPLLLHLARRTEQESTVFAALRWLEARPRPRSRIRLEEGLLLALRLLLLATLALLLAQPVIRGAPGGRAWVVVEPGLDPAAARAALAAPEAEWRWLAPGFPGLDRDPPTGVQPVSSLLRELDAELREDAALTVLVPKGLAGLDGERPVLHRAVDWRVIETPPPATPPALPMRGTLAVRHARAEDPALRYLSAAGAAWAADGTGDPADRPRLDIAPVPSAIPPDTRWLVWLAPGALPADARAWIEAGGRALLGPETTMPVPATGAILWRDARGEPLARGRALGDGHVVQLTRPLAPAGMPEVLDPSFPDRLRELLEPRPTPERAFAATQAPLPGGPALPPVPRPLHPWLAMLVAVLFLAERWMATSPRRERPS
jgi:hypothetical protein